MPALTRLSRGWLGGPWPTRLFVTAVLGAAAGVGLARSAEPALAFHALAQIGAFEVRYVKLAGQKETSDSAIVASVGLTPSTSLLAVDVEDARRRIEALPWIEAATVRKVLPGTLDVTVEEAAAFARWRHEGVERLVAADGAVLADEVPRGFAELPLVGGTGANRRAKEIVALLEASPMYGIRTRASVLVNERRWDLVLDTGATVMLPEEGALAALDRLELIERSGAITASPIVIDLRLPDRAVVELEPQGEAELYIAPEPAGSSGPADLLAAAIARATEGPSDPLAEAIERAMQ